MASTGMGLLYRRFFDAYKKKHPSVPALTAAAEATEEWKRARTEFPEQGVFEEHVNRLIDSYLADASSCSGTGGNISAVSARNARTVSMAKVNEKETGTKYICDLTYTNIVMSFYFGAAVEPYIC